MIFVSIGHHPYSKGAAFEDFNEFDEAKQWAPLLCNALGSMAMQVPVGVLREKVHFINEHAVGAGDHLALEIHFNSDPAQAGRGSETLYYPGSERGRHVAEEVQQNLSRVFGPNRGAKEGWYRMDRSKGPDYFLARTACPAIIVEPEFVHNAEKIVEGRDAGCAAIAQVLVDLYGG